MKRNTYNYKTNKRKMNNCESEYHRDIMKCKKEEYKSINKSLILYSFFLVINKHKKKT